MTSKGFLLSALRMWVSSWEETLSAEGITLHLDDSRAEWAKASLTLAMDGPEVVGQLTLWDSGEAELECAEVATEQTFGAHRILDSVAELHEVLSELMRRVRGG